MNYDKLILTSNLGDCFVKETIEQDHIETIEIV